MGLRRKFSRWLLRKANQAYVSAFMDTNKGNYASSVNPEELIAKIKGWTYTCIRLNGTAVAQVPLRLYRKVGSTSGTKSNKQIKAIPVSRQKQDFLKVKLAERISGGDDLEEITEHPIIDLLRNVNPWDNSFDLKDNTARYLDALGVAFWYKERKLGEVVNIWPLMAQYVSIEKGNKQGIKLYKYGKGENKKEINPKDIVHFRSTSLTSIYEGDSGLKSGQEAIDLNSAMNLFEINSFKNGAAPSAVMTVPVDGIVNDDDKKRIRNEFKRSTAGVDNVGKLAITSGGADIKPWGFAPKDMNYIEGRNTTLEEICALFGVPVSFVRPEGTNRANMWALLDFWMNFTINPKLVMIEQKLNEQFTPEWGEGLYLLFDDARPKDREYRLKEIEGHLKTGYSSINEERMIDGKEPVEWGDEPYQMQSTSNPQDSTPANEEKPKSAEIQTKKQGPVNELPKADFTPKIFLNQMIQVFSRMKHEIEQGIKNYKPKVKADTPEDAFVGSIDDVVSSIFDSQKWAEAISATATPYIKGLVDMALVEALEQINPEAFVNVSSPSVLRALDSRREQIKTVSQTIQGEVRQTISRSIGAGESRSQAIKRIRDEFDARYKADRVVRTETIWAHNEGTVQAWKQSGVVVAKRWDTAPDERRCPYCREMDGKTIGLNDRFFAKGDSMTVGDVSLDFSYEEIKHPPLHPQCRCSLIPIIED